MIILNPVPSIKSGISTESDLFIKYGCLILFVILSIVSTLSANSVDLQLNQTDLSPSEVMSLLVLNGIIVSEEEHSSVAILTDNRSGENLILKIGETIDNFRLVQILENRIVLQRNNETYQLFLGKSGAFKPIQKEEINSILEEEIRAKQRTSQTPEKTVITKELSRSYLEQRILAEWKMILDRTEIAPLTEKGQRKGFKLKMVPEGSLISEIGLQRGDIILEFNGEELKDKSFIISLIEKFRNDVRGSLTIERNGKLIRYDYSIK